MTLPEIKATVANVIHDIEHIAGMPNEIRGAALFIAKGKLLAILEGWPEPWWASIRDFALFIWFAVVMFPYGKIREWWRR